MQNYYQDEQKLHEQCYMKARTTHARHNCTRLVAQKMEFNLAAGPLRVLTALGVART